ncbi:MAG: roadblock/LC7 domain-containing protein [Pseudomonadota bacterium]|nr:MAG: hypothetical protein DIU72_07660 [Pseudomonadota bacterium]
MAFREHLENVCQVEGAVLACVMGFDGIAVDTHAPKAEGLDTDTLLVEYSALLDQVRRAAASLGNGKLEEVVVRAENLTAILRPIDENYFLFLALEPNGNTGKGRFLLRVTAPKLLEEL